MTKRAGFYANQREPGQLKTGGGGNPGCSFRAGHLNGKLIRALRERRVSAKGFMGAHEGRVFPRNLSGTAS